MLIDNSLYMMKVGGRPNDSTAWSSLWAVTANYSSSIDLTQVTNRQIAAGGYVVFRIGTAFAQAANDSTWQIVNSAAATLGTDTVLWSSGTVTNTILVHGAVGNWIPWVVPLPRKFPLRYLGVLWTPATSAFTAGTMDIFITPNAPIDTLGAVV
jgi:hypothetical protein